MSEVGHHAILSSVPSLSLLGCRVFSCCRVCHSPKRQHQPGPRTALCLRQRSWRLVGGAVGAEWCSGHSPVVQRIMLKGGRGFSLFLIVMEKILKTNFKEAAVSVVDCPDLSEPPFTLAAPGE